MAGDRGFLQRRVNGEYLWGRNCKSSQGKAVIAVDTNLLVRLLTNDEPDALHLASSAKADRFATFDRDFVKKASKLGSIGIFKP